MSLSYFLNWYYKWQSDVMSSHNHHHQHQHREEEGTMGWVGFVFFGAFGLYSLHKVKITPPTPIQNVVNNKAPRFASDHSIPTFICFVFFLHGPHSSVEASFMRHDHLRPDEDKILMD